MRAASLLHCVLAAVSLQSIVASPQRRQCQTALDTAKLVASRLQSHSFNSATGQYIDGSLWTDTNALEDLHNLMLFTGSNDYSTVADTSYLGRAAINANTNWVSFLGGSNDDALWIVLALRKMADYKTARGISNAQLYNASAEKVYNIISQQWDTTVCGGGVWWSTAHTYKNAITNQLFLTTSALGYIRTKNQAYLDNAKKVWAWMERSGMRNSVGLWNDGLDSATCKNNGQTTWTYNQGVIASGLGALYAITGNATLLAQAEITLDAVIKSTSLTVNNILKESCDNSAAGGTPCNHDQQLFKGLWTKHVSYYLDQANDATRTAKYSGYLGSQQSAVIHFGKNAANDIGSVWYAPDSGGSVFTPETSTSGLAALIAAAKYATC